MGDAAMGFSSDAAIGFTGERHGSQRWWCAQVGGERAARKGCAAIGDLQGEIQLHKREGPPTLSLPLIYWRFVLATL
jgi:hypothetical protein